jgi:hypothetical protein
VVKTLGNLVLVHIGWFASVLGGARGFPLAGPAVVLLLVLAHLRFFGTKREGWLLVASGALGAIAESLLGLTGLVTYRADPPPHWLCPPWIAAMWVNFAMTLRHSLRWLEGRWALAILFGILAGPIAYVGGARLGAIELLVPSGALAALAGLWGAALPGLALLSRKLR